MTIYTTAIGNYVSQRVADNRQWYESKNMLDGATDLPKSAEVLYHLLQYALFLLINDGHTVMVLGVSSDDKFALANHLPKWQITCLSPVLDRLQQAAGEVVDFADIFCTIQNASHSESKTDWSVLIARLKHRYMASLNKNTHNHAQISHLLAVFELLLRAFFVMNKIRSLPDLVKTLQSNLFFADIIKVQQTTSAALLCLQPPIDYVYQHEILWLWTHRAYQAEMLLMRHIIRLAGANVPQFSLDIPDGINDKQRAAMAMIGNQAFSIITGGPGTGKTFTVAQIVIALARQQMPVRLSLVAPTGKAAQRMGESLQAAMPDDVELQLPEPKTIHRLLGIGTNGQARYHADNPLPQDMIIIDEASMLGVELANQLFAAIATGCRVILLGDANQLAAVDAGAVLADLCRIDSLGDLRVHLDESRRFDGKSGVGRLATLINQQSYDNKVFLAFTQLHQACHDVAYTDIEAFVEPSSCYDQLAQPYQDFFAATYASRFEFAKLSDDKIPEFINNLFNILNKYRILCAAHKGDFGDEKINEYLTKIHKKYQKMPTSLSDWYHGRVVMINKNLYEFGLFNGDVGICLYARTGLTVYFEGESLRAVPAQLISDAVVTTAYAITVHKSQGSEWQQVAVVFDENNARLLSKELFYTAVTRAKSQVQIFSTADAIAQAMTTPTIRQTGLAKTAEIITQVG
ncbi:exodeoxyribonuclease V subunit alpha [Moraxella cuniculi]|uniref:RecBCD enzyme subunit RecD n=1 Tax=Moraxella cuniculi TaxID=34061 RepID=A0A3S5EFY4_9GAMM|nr:exodeoxyribonuclease V subunit alpha [Moraxella cuniculi]VEG13323.1 Exodeoxyribonuclease V alpha chain [Moraxella cuniculi]